MLSVQKNTIKKKKRLSLLLRQPLFYVLKYAGNEKQSLASDCEKDKKEGRTIRAALLFET